MRAVERAWSGAHREYWAEICQDQRTAYDKGGVTEADMWRYFFESAPTNRNMPLRVRYSNGQLCTFRRKSPPQGGEG